MKSIRNISLLVLTVFTISILSCKKDKHIPPVMNFKTVAGYTSANVVTGMDSTIKVGILADKVEDDMISYNVSYSYDGASTTVTYLNFTLAGSEQQHYDKDVTFTTRSVAGTERWTFTITDRDGNIAQKQIVLTVQ